jgi:hypothetical protein
MTTMTVFSNPPTEIQYDEKLMKKQLSKEQDIICMSPAAYVAYLQVSLTMRNPKAKVVKSY